jgi:pyrimidine operon attenuation protein/uracil phosphoribosyltransferase
MFVFLSCFGKIFFEVFMEIKAKVMNNDDMARSIKRISFEIAEKNDVNNVAVLGIFTRGVALGRRITEKLEEIVGKEVPFGILDIRRFRDDLDENTQTDEDCTQVHFNLKGKDLILVDDVLFTGRTVRAALNATVALGRPATVQLAALIDRGHRELPIKADYVGKNVPTALTDEVQVRVNEVDEDDSVIVYGEKL